LLPKAVGPLILVFGKVQNFLKASQINLQLVPSGLNRNFGFPKLSGRYLGLFSFLSSRIMLTD
jgi:hypothetical protein